jgi:uncharacterized protein YjbJ (UPF0337 family)
MEWITIESGWDDFKASAKLRWGKLSVAQINGIAGKRDELLRRVREAYALTQEDAERQVAEWQVKHAHKHLPAAEG